MPGSGLNHVPEPPEPGFPRVGTCTNKRPAFTRRQLDNAVNVCGIDMVGFARDAMNQFAVPTAARIQMEHLFDIAAIEDLGVETPGVIMWGRVRLFHLEPVQCASVIQMVFGESPRHPLDTDDPRTVGNAGNSCRALDAGRGGTRPNNVGRVGRVGRKYYPEGRSSAEAFREVVKTFHHERVHQRLTQAFSLLGRPALYLKMGAYKRSFILRYIEEAAAETYALLKVGGARPGEIAGYRFPLNVTTASRSLRCVERPEASCSGL